VVVQRFRKANCSAIVVTLNIISTHPLAMSESTEAPALAPSPSPGTASPCASAMPSVCWRWFSSSRASEFDEGQVLATFEVARDELKLHAALTAHGLRRVFRGLDAARKPLPRLISRPVSRGRDPEVHFIGRHTTQRRVRPQAVEPQAKHAHLFTHLRQTIGYKDLTQPGTLECPPESLQQSDAPTLSDRAKARPDTVGLTTVTLNVISTHPLAINELPDPLCWFSVFERQISEQASLY